MQHYQTLLRNATCPWIKSVQRTMKSYGATFLSRIHLWACNVKFIDRLVQELYKQQRSKLQEFVFSVDGKLNIDFNINKVPFYVYLMATSCWRQFHHILTITWHMIIRGVKYIFVLIVFCRTLNIKAMNP